MTRATLLIVALCLGCTAKHPVQAVVPAQCIRVKVAGFTKPCRPISDSAAVCDGVVIQVSCVRYK